MLKRIKTEPSTFIVLTLSPSTITPHKTLKIGSKVEHIADVSPPMILVPDCSSTVPATDIMSEASIIFTHASAVSEKVMLLQAAQTIPATAHVIRFV